MAHSPNICGCILNDSESASSEFVRKCCCNNRFSRDQYNFMSQRNYEILKKVCKKLFQNFNRSQCREKYTIFDGGNSINIRIHRANSHGDDGCHDYRYTRRMQHVNDYVRSNNERSLQQQQDLGQKINKNDSKRKNVYDQRSKKQQDDVSKNQADENEQTFYRRRKPKFKQKEKNDDRRGIESDESSDKRPKSYGKSQLHLSKRETKQKRKPDDRRNQQDRRLGSELSFEENYENTVVIGKSYTKRRIGAKAESNKSPLKYGEVGYEGHGQITSTKNISKNRYSGSTDDDINSENGYSKRNPKKGSKSRSKGTKETIPISDGIDKGTKKIHNKKSRVYSDHNEQNVEQMNNKGKKKLSRAKIEAKQIHHVTNDSRNKVRRGEDYFFDDRSRFTTGVKITKTLTLPHTQNRTSRTDDIKACDYLRAQMEQRELWKDCCRLRQSQCIPCASNHKLLAPCYCPNYMTSYISEICKR